MSRRVVLCAGIAVLDHVFRVERPPALGAKARAHGLDIVIGGCAANAAVAVARLDGMARLAAPLGGPPGHDAAGDQIVAILEAEGVDCSSLERVTGARAPISAVLVDRSAERSIVNYRDEALAAARASDCERLCSGVDAVLIDDLYPAFVRPVAEVARRRQIPVVLDCEHSQADTSTLFALCSHVIFSAPGLRKATGLDDLGPALRRFAENSGAFLAVTTGERGVWWLDEGQVRHLPAFAVDAKDTLAAGDVFHGAFALALAEGEPAPSALRFAAAAAALKCRNGGGGSGAPRRAEVAAMLRNGAPSWRSVSTRA